MLLLEKCLVQSSPSLLRPASGLLLYIQSTQREWSTMAFMCRGTLGSTQRSLPPSALPKAPSSVVASWAEPPAAVSSSALVFNTPSYAVARWTTLQQSKQTDESKLYGQATTLLLIRRPLIHFVRSVESLGKFLSTWRPVS